MAVEDDLRILERIKRGQSFDEEILKALEIEAVRCGSKAPPQAALAAIKREINPSVVLPALVEAKTKAHS